MSKFKITLKVTGLELQIEGSRDDVPLMAQAAGQQLAGLFMPASDVVEGEVIASANHLSAPLPERGRKSGRKSPRQKSQAGNLSLEWSRN